MNSEYRHYFCSDHADQQQAIMIDDKWSGIKTEWIELAAPAYTCGLWSEKDTSAEVFHKGKGCGKPATQLLRGTGGNPIQYFSPVKDFGWIDPIKSEIYGESEG
jgi:hypothetical protein